MQQLRMPQLDLFVIYNENISFNQVTMGLVSNIALVFWTSGVKTLRPYDSNQAQHDD